MKIIRIILLLLIIIGIAALATEKTWVPKLVNHIILTEGLPQPLPIRPAQVTLLHNGRFCYSYEQVATAAAPYTVTELLDITINGSVVTGTKTGKQDGPDMHNGYTGIINGTRANDSITDIFSYTIEGSNNQEKEIYRATPTGLEKLRYPLLEGTSVLQPNMTQPFTALPYIATGCNNSM